MGKTFSGDKIYFDELGAEISEGITYDSNHNWDADFGTGIHSTGTLVLEEIYITNEILAISIQMNLDTKESYANSIDLMPLIPEKFRNSVVLQQFIDTANLNTGQWLGYIHDTQYLLDPYNVGEDYLQYLADLIGLTFVINENTTSEEKRRQLLQAIDWYKSKGTYQALLRIGYILGINLNIYDLYTNSEVNYDAGNFTREDWYAGIEGTNPGGLDSTYFKTPHIDIDIVLDKVYVGDPYDYLFISQTYTDLVNYVEKIRPVNVVPHYNIVLTPVTDETFTVTTVSGNIKTIAYNPWTYTKIYWDESDSDAANFDDAAHFFDYSDSGYLLTITKWQLGITNKGVSPDTSGFTLGAAVLSGSIDSITIYSDRAEFLIEVPNSTTQSGVSELGLFLNDNTTLKIASTFPDIDIVSGLTLRILVKLYFNRS